MGVGGQQTEAAVVFSWEEVQKHCSRNDRWLVISRKVYNITQWAKRHPGGSHVIGHYAGEDATEAFTAFHPDQTFVQKFLKPLLIGELAATEPSQEGNKNAAIIQDFETLRTQVEKEGLFKAKPLFFCLHLSHILLLEALAWMMVWYWGTSWTLTLLCAVMLATSQAQAGWLQHDFGHLSVFKKSKWNHLVHKFVIGHLKGAAASWWNHLHYNHHAKPNVLSKDPDVNMSGIFVLGSVQPVEASSWKKICFKYFEKFVAAHKLSNTCPTITSTSTSFYDLAWYLSFYIRYFSCYVPLYGFFGSVALNLFVRFLESHWFVWVTQMNHLPMNIDHDKNRDWITMQLQATSNIEKSFFNDWFSGHLNFQIEHHLFPRMPRHNYHLVAPRVRALCDKHGISYQMKTLWQGMTDVVSSLKTSGDLWLDAYLHK
uniref:acyl-CoA (8-3)-desaturase n=1 Tax=Xiphophorus couchianus TaxID=32473 RepID=A0A3B5MZI8_9TELE